MGKNHQTLRQRGFVRLIITIQWVKEGEGRREEGVEERRRRRRRRRRRKHAGESKRPPPAPLAVGLALTSLLLGSTARKAQNVLLIVVNICLIMWFFTESAHWADSVIELPCPDVCLSVRAIGCSFF